jgi:1,2-phenylacetyl-CoA epoxidase PaaB subunit
MKSYHREMNMRFITLTESNPKILELNPVRQKFVERQEHVHYEVFRMSKTGEGRSKPDYSKFFGVGVEPDHRKTLAMAFCVGMEKADPDYLWVVRESLIDSRLFFNGGKRTPGIGKTVGRPKALTPGIKGYRMHFTLDKFLTDSINKMMLEIEYSGSISLFCKGLILKAIFQIDSGRLTFAIFPKNPASVSDIDLTLPRDLQPKIEALLTQGNKQIVGYSLVKIGFDLLSITASSSQKVSV